MQSTTWETPQSRFLRYRELSGNIKTTLVLPHLAKLQQKILLLATGALPAEMSS